MSDAERELRERAERRVEARRALMSHALVYVLVNSGLVAIDWYTGGIQELWPKGANFKVYDVKTGIVWTAHRWSGGKHVDAEPLTAADTARLCRSYGVTSADQIASQNLWQRRPLLLLYVAFLITLVLTVVPLSLAVQALLRPFLTRRLATLKQIYEQPSGSGTERLTQYDF